MTGRAGAQNGIDCVFRFLLPDAGCRNGSENGGRTVGGIRGLAGGQISAVRGVCRRRLDDIGIKIRFIGKKRGIEVRFLRSGTSRRL